MKSALFIYKVTDHESEKASNSYLMSLIAVIAGLPFPIINLIATLIFYLGNKRSTYFVRWHCTQALSSQFSLLLINSICFYWTLAIVFGPQQLSNFYIGYALTVILFNVIEFIATIGTAIKVRKGIHVEWWFYSTLTHLFCKS
ncbi:DUF4870 domain-containing protein [Solitalea sp. MAHUQ-68]|uniref:DUF4870 domain-containing protein n=1 Tax=Solitalea agri TaxID=2953739 RepID=A0A9X2JBX7_9SPHI|nr:DUF4870 domain-containing protein [Solitalea agri]MCO4291924.1 DUF4870 domain-containing protein [Solitalea agri]